MINITLIEGTITETGIWCDICMLPSIVMVPLNIINGSGVTTIGPLAHCRDFKRHP